MYIYIMYIYIYKLVNKLYSNDCQNNNNNNNNNKKKSMGSFDNKITRILKANTSENFSKPKHTKKVYKG